MLPKEAMASSRPPSLGGGRLAPPRVRASLSVVVTLLVVLVSLIGPAASQGAFPGANGKIAFSSNRDGNGEIYVMNGDGSSPTRLTSNTADEGAPAWSPDGTKIVFATLRDSNPEIYTMNADGSNQTRLTSNTASDVHPAWSPDGTKIAFSTNRHGGSEIYTMNADGSNQTRLTNNTASDAHPAWSPDGTKIAFHSLRITIGGEIYVMNPDGTGETQVTIGGTAPAWSPDGSKIAFESCIHDGCHETSTTEIYTMNADGSSQTRLTDAPGDDVRPAWSPDGTKIAFSTRRHGNIDEIYTMNADGSSQTRLTNNTFFHSSPDWQPVAVPGGYARPKGATPLRVSLVPAYTPCTAGNRTHGPPLAYTSCHPPAQESNQLTVGTLDANGVAARSAGFAKYTVLVGVPGGVDDADVRVAFQMTDVRHQGTLADYTGELQVASAVRVTDRLGGPANEAGTVTDLEHKLTVPCAATGGAVGATCSATTTFDAVVPGTIKERKRAIWQLGQVRVNDGGPDGLASTMPNTLFVAQGVFVP